MLGWFENFFKLRIGLQMQNESHWDSNLGFNVFWMCEMGFLLAPSCKKYLNWAVSAVISLFLVILVSWQNGKNCAVSSEESHCTINTSFVWGFGRCRRLSLRSWAWHTVTGSLKFFKLFIWFGQYSKEDDFTSYGKSFCVFCARNNDLGLLRSTSGSKACRIIFFHNFDVFAINLCSVIFSNSRKLQPDLSWTTSVRVGTTKHGHYLYLSSLEPRGKVCLQHMICCSFSKASYKAWRIFVPAFLRKVTLLNNLIKELAVAVNESAASTLIQFGSVLTEFCAWR